VTALRITSRAGAAAVAGIAAIASYSHMRDLAVVHGQSHTLAALMPLSVDGLLVVAAVAMADDRAAGRTPRLSARISFVIGVAASILANVLAAPDSLLARAISAWPAVALLLVVEMLSRTGKVAKALATSEPEGGSHDQERDRAGGAGKEARLARDGRLQGEGGEVRPGGPGLRQEAARVRPRSLTAAERVTAAHARHPAASHKRLAEVAGVSLATVKRHRPTGSPSATPPGESFAKSVNGNVPDLESIATRSVDR
jgi:hypothetical protein